MYISYPTRHEYQLKIILSTQVIGIVKTVKPNTT